MTYQRAGSAASIYVLAMLAGLGPVGGLPCKAQSALVTEERLDTGGDAPPRRGDVVHADRSDLRTYFRPVFSRLAVGDPMQIAIHWATEAGRIPRDGRYAGTYSPSATLESMEVRIVTPTGEAHRLHPQVGPDDPESTPDQIPYWQQEFAQVPTLFMELTGDGFRTLVLKRSGTWQEADAPSLTEAGQYQISVSGQIIIDSQQPIPFQTDEATIERVAEGVLPLDEIRRRAVAGLQEAVKPHPNEQIVLDTGHYGDFKALQVLQLPSHHRVVLLAIEHRWEYTEIADQYRVVLTPDGTIEDITHWRQTVCVAAGTDVETEHGPQPIEQLRPGDQVWSFDTESARLLLTSVEAIHHSKAPAVYEITPALAATAEHPVYANGRWVSAEKLRSGDLVVGRDGAQALPASPRLRRERTAVVDLSVGEPHNFFAGGLLVHNKTLGLGIGHYDGWKQFHTVASPYAEPVADRGSVRWWTPIKRTLPVAAALLAIAAAIYLVQRRPRKRLSAN